MQELTLALSDAALAASTIARAAASARALAAAMAKFPE